MEQERLSVLEMLAQGKVTPEEAAALLDALEQKAETSSGTATSRGAGRRNSFENFGEGVGAFASRVAAWGAEFGARISEEIREGRVPVLNWLGDCFDGKETVHDSEGEFAGEIVEIDCACDAGTFHLRGGDAPGYRLLVRQRFGGAEGPEIQADGGSIRIRGNGIVKGELTLPKDRRYKLRLKSSAGRLEAEELRLTEADVQTDAGGVRLKNLSAARLDVRSSAGSIEGTGLTARDLRAETDCGRVHIELAPMESGQCSLETDVGAVSLVVPLRPELGYRLQGKADVGNITVGPEFRVTEEIRSVGNRRLAAESPDYASRPQQVEVRLRTDCGSIRVSARG